MIKCGSHQVALTAKYGVIGDAARAAAQSSAVPESVTAPAVRVYKSAIRDYYEDFVNSVRTLVHTSLAQLAREISSQQKAAALQSVYTVRVIPDAMLQHVVGVTRQAFASYTAAERSSILKSTWPSNSTG